MPLCRSNKPFNSIIVTTYRDDDHYFQYPNEVLHLPWSVSSSSENLSLKSPEGVRVLAGDNVKEGYWTSQGPNMTAQLQIKIINCLIIILILYLDKSVD
jgi:hypothetical protein